MYMPVYMYIQCICGFPEMLLPLERVVVIQISVPVQLCTYVVFLNTSKTAVHMLC